MTRYIFAALMAVGITATLTTVGCDDTISKQEEVKTSSDGTMVHKKDEVKKTPDGSVVHEETKTVDKP